MDIREHVVALNEKRLRAAKAMEALVDDAHKRHPGEPFSAEERASFDKMNEEIDALDSEIRAFVQREEAEADHARLRDAQDKVFGTGTTDRQVKSEGEVIRSYLRAGGLGNAVDEKGKQILAVDLRKVANERQMLRDGASPEEVRSLLWDTGSIASGVPTTMARTLYGYLEASIAAFRMPTTKITTESGETMHFPRVGAHGIATQVSGQGTTIAGTDPTFARLQLDAYKYGEVVQLSSETVQDTGFDIVGWVAQNIGRAVGRVIDADLVVGTGSGEPQGMMTAVTVGAAGTVATGGSLITPTYENLVDLVYSVNDEYRASGNAAFLMRDATAGNLRKLRDGAGGTVGAVLWEPSLTQGIQNGQPDRLLGFPVYTDPNVASLASNARIITFGDWNAYYTRLVGSLTIERSDEFAFATDLVTFRGKQRVDGDFIDLTAVNLLKQSV